MRFRWILKRANFETAVSVVEWGNCCSHCKHHFSEANSEISLFFFKPRKSFPPFSSLMTTNEGLRVKFFTSCYWKKGTWYHKMCLVVFQDGDLIISREQKHSHVGHGFSPNEGQHCISCFLACSWAVSSVGRHPHWGSLQRAGVPHFSRDCDLLHACSSISRFSPWLCSVHERGYGFRPPAWARVRAA